MSENDADKVISTIRGSALWLLILAVTSCVNPSPGYPNALDSVLVHREVTQLINGIRTSHEVETLLWDESLQSLAEGRAWTIVKGETPFGEVNDSLANELGERAAELRACLSADEATPAGVAEAAVNEWMQNTELHGILTGNWERIGVGFDWGCPDAGGVVLVVLLAGGECPASAV